MNDTQSPAPHLARQANLRRAIQSGGFDALALNPGPSLVYLTGLHFHLMERPVVALFTPQEDPLLVLPELEAGKTTGLPYPIRTCTYPEDPTAWAGIFGEALSGLHLKPGARIGVEPRGLRFLELRLLENAAPQAHFLAAEEIIAAQRLHKDPHEVSAMRKAVEIAQNALESTLPAIRIGMSEKELAAELVLHLLQGGSDPKLPFEPILCGGPNSANPHAVPGERRLQPGDLLVIDWGASYQGYLSDLTRTFAVGEVSPEFQAIARITAEANLAGREAARPGRPIGAVDAAARQVIEKAGYGAFFTHRTGHGLGMEVHEEPYIRGDNLQLLEPGMTFTIEPGIYLPGRGGVRVEDDVVITRTGCESLSDLPRDLRVVG